jgi:hypothetical protein
VSTSNEKRPFFKRLSPFYLFLIAISPIFISLSIHIIALILSSQYTWSIGSSNLAKQDVYATILLDGKKEDRLRFQGTDELDSFRADHDEVYPIPEVDYRPTTPEVDFYPEPEVHEEIDIISLNAATTDHEWVNLATGGQPLYTGPERLVGSFSNHIQVLREGGLDVVFVFDSTSSMTAYINEVKLKIENLVLTFKKLVPTCRIGLVTYRDRSDKYLTKIHPLSYGTSSLKEFLTGIEADGGNDFEEAVEVALKVAVEEITWNKKAGKFILLIGDAPPHKQDMPTAVEMIRKFKEEMGGIVSALDVRKPVKPSKELWKMALLRSDASSSDRFSYLPEVHSVMDEFQIFAEQGGGECARLTNEEKVIKHMLLLIFGTRWEMNLDEFMKHL